ncbi:nicotinamide-nucleotide amidohydrolase family protein [Iamia majanohamensis]|uniref:Nicotinamide-nucleotide amidohydrolase family protein n=1 Tax=Iamia majanohamensis TaxID=467976 RepID=A0AAF0BWM8_9ACTN|nr:nicotinamide-nucleotide amidohydrolase family protein [Iamia majanohamensis]WCO68243.1 nicotinamide-nucleotide amidohydrolase family protein [Iamia majanohamensis]
MALPHQTPGRVVVVTGATGNLGSRLVDVLAGDPRVAEVRGVARRPPDDEPRPQVRWHAVDITTDDLDPIVDGADVVVHLAWRIQPSWDLDAMWRTNVGGSAAVFAAVRRQGVAALVHASSVGAYAPGPKGPRVDESWPLGGIEGHPYSEQKAGVEAMLDELEADRPGLRVVRMRPALMVAAGAGLELRRYFLPGIAERGAPLHPWMARLLPTRLQLVHTDDAAVAFAEAALGEASGPFNLAAEDPVGAGSWPGLERVLRPLAAVTWRRRLQPVDPGWVGLAFRSPLLDTTRAREELGWAPRHSGAEALEQVLAGIRATDDAPTAALRGEVEEDDGDLDGRIAALAEELAGELRRRDLTLAVAESLTGGLLASRLARAGGASDWFRGGVAAYATEVKHDVLGVRAGGVVRAEAVSDMATGAARLLGADVGLAVSGVGGPDPQEGRPPGTVWVGAVAGEWSGTTLHHLAGTPEEICLQTCVVALEDGLALVRGDGQGAPLAD